MIAGFAILCSLLSVPATAPAARATLVVVVGAPGEAEFGQQFDRWASRWSDAASRAQAKFVAPKDKPQLKAAIDVESTEAVQPLWIVLIGHGTFDGSEAKFNLVGDDLSATELAEWLKPLTRPVALIDCTSASAPFLNKLSGDKRVVITATRSGSEIQFARFGDYISTAITDSSADLDKDGQTSLLEAFIAASHRTQEFYKQQGRLATEHALLDDNADALGVSADWFQGIRATRAARDGAPIDGPRANQWHLIRIPAEADMSAEIRARRDALELQVEALRQKKHSLSESDYYAQLDDLLLQLARLYHGTETQRLPDQANHENQKSSDHGGGTKPAGAAPANTR